MGSGRRSAASGRGGSSRVSIARSGVGANLARATTARAATGRSAATDGRRSVGRGIRLVGAGVGESEIRSLLGGAAVVDVGDEEGGARAQGGNTLVVSLGGASSDGDGGAVHVHLAVANLVEPGPGEDDIARGGVRGDGEVEVGGTRGGAVANVRVNDGPRAALVEGERGLAATTAVVGTTGDGHLVGSTGLVLGGGLARVGAEEGVVSLAGEVATAGGERGRHGVVDVAAGVGVGLGLEGRGRSHFHVSLG